MLFFVKTIRLPVFLATSLLMTAACSGGDFANQKNTASPSEDAVGTSGNQTSTTQQATSTKSDFDGITIQSYRFYRWQKDKEHPMEPATEYSNGNVMKFVFSKALKKAWAPHTNTALLELVKRVEGTDRFELATSATMDVKLSEDRTYFRIAAKEDNWFDNMVFWPLPLGIEEISGANFGPQKVTHLGTITNPAEVNFYLILAKSDNIKKFKLKLTIKNNTLELSGKSFLYWASTYHGHQGLTPEQLKRGNFRWEASPLETGLTDEDKRVGEQELYAKVLAWVKKLKTVDS